MRLARQLVPQLGWNRGLARPLAQPRRSSWTPEQEQRLQAVLAAHPALQGVYEIKEQLCALLRYKQQGKAACRHHARHLLQLIEELRDSRLEAALTLAKTLRDWQQEIARMWRFSKNNGITEGFHRKMKLIQRRAYGFRSFANFPPPRHRPMRMTITIHPSPYNRVPKL